MVIFRYIKALIFEFRVKRAIKKAQRAAELHKKKFLVLLVQGRPLVISKQGLRKAIARGKGFRKDFTPRKAEEIALYIAHPPKPSR